MCVADTLRCGLICGHKTYTSKARWLPSGWKLLALAYVCGLTLFALRHNLIGIDVNSRLVDRALLGPLRAFNFACIAFLVCLARGQMAKFIAWRGFAFLSRHSLQVYAFHLVPLYVVAVLIQDMAYLPFWAQMLAVAFCILSLFGIALLAKSFKDFRVRILAKRRVGCDGPAS